MNLEELAAELVQNVQGDVTDENVKGVIKVLEAIKRSIDENWEQHIAQQTTSTLAFDRVTCRCGRNIHVTRTRTMASVSYD